MQWMYQIIIFIQIRLINIERVYLEKYFQPIKK